jgi:hypothetical protein
MTTLLERQLARGVELEKLKDELFSEIRILKREKNSFLEQIMILQKENRKLQKENEELLGHNKEQNKTFDDDNNMCLQH